jgi:hypothetical protein
LGGTIANNETLKIQLALGLSDPNLLVVLMDLPSKVGGVDASVTLTCNVEVINKIFGEELVPIEESGLRIL